jgi:hypothetical protein
VKQNPKKKSIEAHQMALVAATFSLDLAWDGERPTLKTDDTWPRFSDELDDDDQSSDKKRQLLDTEQIYYQAYVFEHALGSVQTTNAGLANVLFEAWDYYLRALPDLHGVAFEYDIWLERRTVYTHAWNDIITRLENNPKIPRNPFYQLAMFMFENICALERYGQGPILIGIITLGKVSSFTELNKEWIVDSE